MPKELIFSITKNNFDIQTFRSGGKGGQNQNKVESGVRIIHRASGAVGESREHRDQPQNKKAAFKRLINSKKFQSWFKIEVAKQNLSIIEKRKLEKEVDEWMNEKYLKVEIF